MVMNVQVIIGVVKHKHVRLKHLRKETHMQNQQQQQQQGILPKLITVI